MMLTFGSRPADVSLKNSTDGPFNSKPEPLRDMSPLVTGPEFEEEEEAQIDPLVI